MRNLGDIDKQTIAGAIGTGTHGTGAGFTGLAAMVVALDLVTADGEVRHLDASTPDDLAAARVGLGALGVVVAVTLQCEPSYLLRAVERPAGLDEWLEGFDDWVAAHDHAEAYWFPHTRRVLTKANDRVPGPAAPLSRARAWWDDELMSNRVFGALQRGRHRGAAARAADQPGERPRPQRSRVRRHLAQGLLRRAPGALPRDGVRDPARGPAARARRGAGLARPHRRDRRLPGRDPRRRPRRRLALHRLRPGQRLRRLPPVRRPRPHRLLRRRRGGAARPSVAGRTGASCTPSPPPTWPSATRASATSSPSATASTPTVGSPTTTPGASSATDRPVPAVRGERAIAEDPAHKTCLIGQKWGNCALRARRSPDRPRRIGCPPQRLAPPRKGP